MPQRINDLEEENKEQFIKQQDETKELCTTVEYKSIEQKSTTDA